jgi:hypothetical protein
MRPDELATSLPSSTYVCTYDVRTVGFTACIMQVHIVTHSTCDESRPAGWFIWVQVTAMGNAMQIKTHQYVFPCCLCNSSHMYRRFMIRPKGYIYDAHVKVNDLICNFIWRYLHAGDRGTACALIYSTRYIALNANSLFCL